MFIDSVNSPLRRALPICLLIATMGGTSLLFAQPTDTTADPASDVHEMQALQVVTTGTRTERLFTEVPIKTEMLGADDFSAAMAFELGTAIELLNGARTEANCQNCGTAEVQLLGLPGNYNQILIDGLPLFTGVASVYGIDQVPTLFVERIEVVKGGGSSLYGPGAIAGVINLIPEEPFEPHTHLDFTYRNIDGTATWQSQFATHGINGDGTLKASLYGLWADQNAYDANADGFTELVARGNTTLGTYLWWTPTDRTRLQFNYQFIGEERRGGDRLDTPEQFAQVAESLVTDYHWATLRWDQEVSPRLSFSASASAVRFQRDSYYGGTGEERIDPLDTNINPAARTYAGVPPDATAPTGTAAARAAALFGDPVDGSGGGSFNNFGFTDTTSWFIDASARYAAGNIGPTGTHHLVFGFQYETERLHDDQLNADGNFLAVLHDARYRNAGLFLQDEWQLTERLELVPGVRADRTNTLDDWVVSPRLAARWSPTTQLTWRANFSTGFLAPRVFDEDVHIENIGGIPRDIVNAPGLREERSRTVAMGADFTPRALSGRLTTSLQFYATDLRDAFDLDESSLRTVDGREKINRVNTAGSSVLGWEWDAAWQLDDRWALNAGLAYSRARFDEPDPDRGTDRYNKTPDWTGQLQLIYTRPDALNGFLAVKWTGDMLADRLDSVVPGANPIERTPDFFVVDLGLSKTIPLEHVDLTLRASINNLFDAYQDDHERGASRDPGYIYGPRHPRTWTLGARLDF